MSQPPDITFTPNFYNSKESKEILQQLISKTNWKQERITLYGIQLDVPRLTAWEGNKSYSYSGIKMSYSSFSEQVQSLKLKVEKHLDYKFNSVLLNYYRDGNDSVAWHSDDEYELGKEPLIASISFGAIRKFKVRSKSINPFELRYSYDYELEDGSLLIMKGATQQFYQHCIPKTKKLIGPRVNLTFRSVITE